MLDRIADELRAGLRVRHQHDLVLVILNCLGCEVNLTETNTPGRRWDVDPHSPRDITLRFVTYYLRKERKEVRTRPFRTVAEAFERRARIGEPMTGMFFLDNAWNYYLDAGLRDEAERVKHNAQKMRSAAEKQLVPMTVKQDSGCM